MAYKLLALDMDGTLLSSQKTVLPKTRDALAALFARGIPVAYCTGRCVRELMDYPRELPFIRYGVLGSGAVVFDFKENAPLNVLPVETDVLVEAIGIARQEDVMLHAMTAYESVATEADIAHMERFGMGIYHGMFASICTRTDDHAAWVRTHPGEVAKLNMYHLDPAARERTRARIVEAGLPLTMADAEKTSLECSALGVSKAKGLALLADRMGIDMCDIVAVGDSDNDLEALRSVGMPVAMGNASPKVRDIARLMVADNDHDGIVDVVEQLF